MSYKCAIFGHKFGETEVDREREEDGNEVITTVRETETCLRCEETRVVSENKEVTTLETAAEIVADDLAEDERAGEPAGATATDEPAIREAESGDVADPTPPQDAAEDDAVILDDGEDEREPGEWPEEPDDDEGADSTWQDEEGADTDRDVDRESAAEVDGEPSWELPDGIDPHPETEDPTEQLQDAERSRLRSTGNALTVPEGEFYCPDCEFTRPVESSSLREGDFCPECHGTTLEHRVG